MNKQFLIHCVWLLLGSIVGAAAIAAFAFVLFALGDSIFATGRGV